jgi:hypothetical protein
MHTKRIVACLIAAVMAFSAFAVAATTAFTSGHSVWKGHTLTHEASIDPSATLSVPAGTYHDV